MQEKTWITCMNFESREKCLYRNEKLMDEFISDMGEVGVDLLDDLRADPKPLTSETRRKGEEINKQFCSNCETFKPITTQTP